MGLREIVGITVTGFILVYCFWFIVPALKTAYTGEIKGLNMTTPIMQQLKPVADSWFLIMIPLIIFVGGYTIYLYMTRISAEDDG